MVLLGLVAPVTTCVLLVMRPFLPYTIESKTVQWTVFDSLGVD